MAEINSEERRTQAQRRADTRASLLSSACRLFGESGYDSTALEDIAGDCGLTIRPIYYHFGSKRGLFFAVNEQMEQRALDALSCASAVGAWEAFVALCEDRAFRRIILVDAPNVLGRERWSRARFLPWYRALDSIAPGSEGARDSEREMCARVALATLTEAAIVVAETGYDAGARQAALQLISTLLPETGGERSAGFHHNELSLTTDEN